LAIRIIGGELKGRKLVTVPGMLTRPTADRVRESIFNILGDRVRGARIMDLYSGTGAMGIEALSRGAESVLFMDNHPAALAALKNNIKKCSLESKAATIQWNILSHFDVIRSYQPAFNLVFLDPPYNKNMIQPTLANLDRSRCLENRADIIIEHSAREPFPENLPGFILSDQRRYGKTLVSFSIYMV
jgi:16S rRNA (guanine966-N2)-methyltransferase